MNSLLSIFAIIGSVVLSFAAAAETSAGSESAIPGAESYPLAEKGADLAHMWCSSCHVTNTGVQESVTDSASPFSMLAPQIVADPDHYRTFLTKPHGPMTGISLSRDEIEAVLSYMSSLADEPAAK